MIGNSLNAGTSNGDALGFKFNSILKLDTVKACNQTTAMDFLVHVRFILLMAMLLITKGRLCDSV